jgi:hypothetical protein
MKWNIFQATQMGIEAERKLDLYADVDYAGQTPAVIGLIPRGTACARVCLTSPGPKLRRFFRFPGDPRPGMP